MLIFAIYDLKRKVNQANALKYTFMSVEKTHKMHICVKIKEILL